MIRGASIRPILAILTMVLVTASTGLANEPLIAPLDFNIAAQSLTAALERYSTICGRQVLYDAALAQNRRSTAVVGHLAPEAALQTLLTGTDLVVRYTDNQDFVLMSPAMAKAADQAKAEADRGGDATAPDDTETGDGTLALATLTVDGATDVGSRADFRDYATVVRSDIQAALHRNEVTRAGNYTIGVKIWVDGVGDVTRSEIVQSTGDDQRDGVIAGVLHDLRISKAPPQDMPQPVSVMIAARPL